MQDINVAILQAHLLWDDESGNLLHLDQHIKELPQNTDLVVLPEMFTTGFILNSKVNATTVDGAPLSWMKKWSKKLDCCIMGTVLWLDGGQYYNRCISVSSEGVFYQDKRHLFTMAGEEKTFTASVKRNTFKYKGWTIFPTICYDLRFPVWSRNDLGYDVNVVMANWPEKRIHHWDALLKARAIENQSYVVACNRVGVDGNEFPYNGHSQIIDPAGEVLAFNEGDETIVKGQMNQKHLTEVRAKLPFLNDRDAFDIQNLG